MDATSVAVHCYWNGRVKKEKGDVHYEGIDRWDFELNIICRYPISSREYKPIPIENDEAVELMLEVPIKSGVYCVEIYLERDAVYGGNDGLFANEGNDGLLAEKGDDSLFTDEDNVGLFADEGDDGLFANEGDDGLFVDEGDDDLFTNEGDDGLFVDEGDDGLFVDKGDDDLFADEGDDGLFADEGDDGLFDGLFADEGDDGLFGDEGDDGLFVDEGDDGLSADEGDDGLFADEGNDDLFADEFLSKDGNGNRSVPRLLSYGIGRNYGETSSKNSYDPSTYDDSKMEGRKWEELNMECLVNVFQKVGMESLLLDVPLVCKSWHKASLDPKCWEHLIFPKHLEPDDDIWDIDSFAERLMMEDQENFAVTAFIKFVIDRSRGCATTLRLPGGCTEEALEYAANECPQLKILRLNTDLLSQQARIIPKLIPKWKNLQVLVLGSRYKMEEILAQIAIHCNNFVRLSAPGIYVGNKDASAIVTSLPNLSYLVLKEATIERKSLVIILQGCKQLVHLDVRGCIGFDEDDAKILELASHIPSFMCEGSCLYDPYDYDDLSYEDYDKDHYDYDYYFD